jgi:hypothetical protein
MTRATPVHGAESSQAWRRLALALLVSTIGVGIRRLRERHPLESAQRVDRVGVLRRRAPRASYAA